MEQLEFPKKGPVIEDVKRRQYLEQSLSKTEQFQAICSKVKTPAITVSAITATAGGLLLAAGAASLMVWSNPAAGLGLGIPGLIAAALAYPIYRGMIKSRKRKFAGQMMALDNRRIDRGEVRT